MAEPISIAELKLYIKMDLGYELEDTILESMIKTARMWCEKYTGLTFMPKTLEIFSDKWSFEVPNGPIMEIISVKDANGDDINYHKKGLQFPRITTSPNQDAYVIVNAGYVDLPEDLKSAVKMMAATLYENREDYEVIKNSDTVVKMPFGVKDLLQPFSRSGGLFI